MKKYFFDNNGKKVFYEKIKKDCCCVGCNAASEDCDECDPSPVWESCTVCENIFVVSGCEGALYFIVTDDPEIEYCSAECLFKAFGVQYFDWLTISR
ncbi:MAG: hypothetical protein V1825_00520 [Candidatus Falkowbacteria bacterium]|nr:hypothetical protein [Candidatus Parcubacteria bacterium]